MASPWRRMPPLISAAFLLSAILVLSHSVSSMEEEVGVEDALTVDHLENMKLKIARLESIQEENNKTLYSKLRCRDEMNKLIEEMENKIQFLQDSLNKIKISQDSSSNPDEKVKAMEEEVQLLWDKSRTNNYNIHILESKAYDDENKLKATMPGIEKMENTVTEQWIQIRQLEQALQTMKSMTLKVQEKNPMKCTILKFLISVRHHSLPEEVGLPNSFFLGNYISSSSISQALNQLKRSFSLAKRWHHELQGSVKRAFETNEFTAPLANDEVIFFVASAIVTIPVMSVWMLCS